MSVQPTPNQVRTSGNELGNDVAPVARAIAAEAARCAEQILGEADAQAEAVLLEARRQGEELLASARDEGTAVARRLASSIVADARIAARQEVLGAQRHVYETVRTQAQARVADLAGSPQADALLASLADLARQRLGDQVTLETPVGGLGVAARSGRRHLDLSVDALIERQMASMGDEIAELWT